MYFKHPRFKAPELEALQKELYRQGFLQWGPSLVRLIPYGWNKTLRNSPKALLKGRAEQEWQEVMTALPGIYPAMLVGPTRKTRAQARQWFSEIRREMGTSPLQERLMGWATLPLAARTWLTFKLISFNNQDS